MGLEIDFLHYPLSDIQMCKLNPDANLVVYDVLNKCFDIDELFRNKDKLIILYLLQSKTSGHWVTLFKKKASTGTDFEFFDSYGLPIDGEIDLLTVGQRNEFNERRDRLKILLRYKNVSYNNIRYQGKGTDTCGMFVTHRLYHSFLSDAGYFSFMRKLCRDSDMTPDEVVADYVMKKLNDL